MLLLKMMAIRRYLNLHVHQWWTCKQEAIIESKIFSQIFLTYKKPLSRKKYNIYFHLKIYFAFVYLNCNTVETIITKCKYSLNHA